MKRARTGVTCTDNVGERCVVLALLIAVLSFRTVDSGAIGRAAPSGQQSAVDARFLGFGIGEEVRYRLERSDGQPVRSPAMWSLRLQQLDAEAGVFVLGYEAGFHGPEPAEGPTTTRTTAHAQVSAYGFPMRVRFTTSRTTPMGELEHSIEYRYADSSFIKTLGDEKEQEARLDDYRVIDLNTPAGIYLFMPIDTECVTSAQRMRGDGGQRNGAPPRGGSPAGGRGDMRGRGRSGSAAARDDMKQPCMGREPVFANPGLLGLTLPALRETAAGQLEFLAFAPTGVRAVAAMGGSGRSRRGGGVNIAGLDVLGGGGPEPFGNAGDAFQMFALSASNETQTIDLGGRSTDVWRLKASAPLDAAYVDGNGKVVRLDLPVDPATGEQYVIRLLHPSEY